MSGSPACVCICVRSALLSTASLPPLPPTPTRSLADVGHGVVYSARCMSADVNCCHNCNGKLASTLHLLQVFVQADTCVFVCVSACARVLGSWGV